MYVLQCFKLTLVKEITNYLCWKNLCAMLQLKILEVSDFCFVLQLATTN